MRAHKSLCGRTVAFVAALFFATSGCKTVGGQTKVLSAKGAVAAADRVGAIIAIIVN